MPTTWEEALRGLATGGIWLKRSSRSMHAFITYGVQLIRMATFWIFWSRAGGDKKAAKKLIGKLLKGLRYVPRVIITDKVKLSDLFKRHSKHLEFISQCCMDELSQRSEFIFEEALTPMAENFKSSNITRDGIRCNFDACRVFACAYGERAVEIPFTALEQL